MHSEYGKLKEVWLGRAYSPDITDDEFVKQILTETEEDLQSFASTMTGLGVSVKRPSYNYIKDDRQPPLLFPRDQLQLINGKLYIGAEYEQDISSWVELLDNRLPYITMDNLNASSIIRADKCYIDANGISRERALYLKNANPEVDFVYDPMSSRGYDNNKHTDGVYTVIKEGVIISTPQSRNLETIFPNWDILYLDHKDRDLRDLADSKKILWSPDQIPVEYRRWVGYSPETFFDVNVLQLDSERVFVTRYNKKVYDFLEKHNVTPIEVPLRHRYLFDGGLHSLTFDYERG